MNRNPVGRFFRLSRKELFTRFVAGSSLLCVMILSAGCVSDNSGNQVVTPPSAIAVQSVSTDMPAAIPGLTSTVLFQYFGGIGIPCPPISSYNGLSGSHCEAKSDNQGTLDVIAEIVGTDDHIYSINVSVFQAVPNPSVDISKRILEQIAQIPYTNAEPAQARLWLDNNISLITPDMPADSEPRAVFGGVRYHLSGPSISPTLNIGYEQGQ